MVSSAGVRTHDLSVFFVFLLFLAKIVFTKKRKRQMTRLSKIAKYNFLKIILKMSMALSKN